MTMSPLLAKRTQNYSNVWHDQLIVIFWLQIGLISLMALSQRWTLTSGKFSLPTFFDLKHKVTVILVHPSNQYQKIIPNTIPYDILMGWYFIRVCFVYTKMRGYESFFSKSAMPVVQSLRAQKGIKNLSEKKYEKTYRIRYGSGYDSIFMRSDSVEGK